jgi:pyruvate dehydrogenase E1 component beta subunit
MPENAREISFAEAVREATAEAMREDESVILYGLGVNDPGRVFGTTAGLVEEFGPERVFETPTAENAMTGIAVGAAIAGVKTIVTHQRFDFFLLAMDQLVNSAAKWRYMFGGQFQVPVVFRLITGRGWGQGPTHSQSYHSWLAHVPGLKVVMPSNALDAKALLKASIEDPNPVVFIENRWLHQTTSLVVKGSGSEELGKSRVVAEGDSLTIVAMGYGVVEALRACKELDKLNIHCEVIDLRTLAPLDLETIAQSAAKTRRLLVVDLAPETGSIAHTIKTGVENRLRGQPLDYTGVLCGLDLPEPTSHGATLDFHVDAKSMFLEILDVLDFEAKSGRELENRVHDVPMQGKLGSF